MIPKNKNISVLHPYVCKKWWAVKMMIHLSNFLHKNNNNIIFYTFSYNKKVFMKDKISFLIKTCFKAKILKFINFFVIAYKIRKSDFIIIWNSPMHFVWVLSKILFFSKAKLIWRNHHYPWYYSNNTNFFIRLKRLLEKIVVKKIDLVLSNGKYLKTVIEEVYNIQPQILYPILSEDFVKTKKIDTKKHNRPKTIFTYGRWVSWKNLQLIFKTYDNLKKIVPNLILVIWGEWEELQKSRVWDKQNKDKNIKILWSLNTKQIILNLQKSDVFLFPSLIDSFWITILESMSIWNPVVCFLKPGQEELVKNGINWYLVESETDFINKTHKILTNNSLREKLSASAIKTSKRFTNKTFEKQLSTIFDLF